MAIKAVLPLLSPANEHKPPENSVAILTRREGPLWHIRAVDRKASKGAQKRAIRAHLARIKYELVGDLLRDEENEPYGLCRAA